ncbi:hypothetical protein MMC13_000394 [Lambiella insularis]|nr:hypothetical protein [Lambiella insularis]
MVASEQCQVEKQLEKERQKLEALVIASYRAKAQSKNKVNSVGLTEVFSPPELPTVDVVFVHGIFGHPKDTWTCEDTECFWPAELLPPILEDEDARILTYGYDSSADTFADCEPKHKVYDVVRNLGRGLASNSYQSDDFKIRKASQRPLVFVAHSMGGLLVKGVLARSSKSSDKAVRNLRSISMSTYGVIFLSTPHNILASHIGLLCDAAIRREACEVSYAIDQLKAKHTALHVLNQEFMDLANQYELHCFREMLELKVGRPQSLNLRNLELMRVQMLDDMSARLSVLHEEATCIQTNHYMISEFSSESSPGFDLVCAVLQNYVYNAPKHISSRWRTEKHSSKVKLQDSTALLPSNERHRQDAASMLARDQYAASFAAAEDLEEHGPEEAVAEIAYSNESMSFEAFGEKKLESFGTGHADSGLRDMNLIETLDRSSTLPVTKADSGLAVGESAPNRQQPLRKEELNVLTNKMWNLIRWATSYLTERERRLQPCKKYISNKARQYRQKKRFNGGSTIGTLAQPCPADSSPKQSNATTNREDVVRNSNNILLAESHTLIEANSLSKNPGEAAKVAHSGQYQDISGSQFAGHTERRVYSEISLPPALLGPDALPTRGFRTPPAFVTEATPSVGEDWSDITHPRNKEKRRRENELEAKDLTPNADPSGLPWGSVSIKHVYEAGKAKEKAEQTSRGASAGSPLHSDVTTHDNSINNGFVDEELDLLIDEPHLGLDTELYATEEEMSRAKDDVIKLLQLWTTCDIFRLTDTGLKVSSVESEANS